MTDRKLAAVALAWVLLVAVASGGATHAILSDTESVDVAVSANMAPPPDASAGATQNGPPASACEGIATPTAEAPNGTNATQNGSGNATTDCPPPSNDGANATNESGGNATVLNATGSDGNESGTATVNGTQENGTNDTRSGTDTNTTASGTNQTDGTSETSLNATGDTNQTSLNETADTNETTNETDTNTTDANRQVSTTELASVSGETEASTGSTLVASRASSVPI
ncbi:hypothetical protein ACKVMT_17605 [Halobacteriales archaeon Cl-PHB]